MLAFMIAAAAGATPQVYLGCDAKTSDGGVRHLQLGLNESEGTVSLSVPDRGYSIKLPAVFNENSVSWNENGWSSVLDRSSLKYHSAEVEMPSTGWNDGHCVLHKPSSNRKF